MPSQRGTKKKSPPDHARQKLRASIDIFDVSIVASRYDGRSVARRLIEPGDLAEVFSELRNSRSQWLKLDKGVVAVGIDTDGRQRHIFVRRGQKTKLDCRIGRKRFTINAQMPNLLAELLCTFREGKRRWSDITDVYAFAGPVSKLNESTQLYVAPLPNISQGSSVCMGSVAVDALDRLDAAEMFEKAFFCSTFTDHTLKEPLADDSKYRNIIDALRKTKGKLPIKELRKVKTYGEIFK